MQNFLLTAGSVCFMTVFKNRKLIGNFILTTCLQFSWTFQYIIEIYLYFGHYQIIDFSENLALLYKFTHSFTVQTTFPPQPHQHCLNFAGREQLQVHQHASCSQHHLHKNLYEFLIDDRHWDPSWLLQLWVWGVVLWVQMWSEMKMVNHAEMTRRWFVEGFCPDCEDCEDGRWWWSDDEAPVSLLWIENIQIDLQYLLTETCSKKKHQSYFSLGWSCWQRSSALESDIALLNCTSHYCQQDSDIIWNSKC